ncbi:MAG: hypothetical protein FWE91_01130 [Defluviitaleaceae bacterium]|nr:hypothetical protein [Defluviitaleaceae bacterium]MCL2835525.1 hypothetical protein [Defluviitaleaceae bacterium]
MTNGICISSLGNAHVKWASQRNSASPPKSGSSFGAALAGSNASQREIRPLGSMNPLFYPTKLNSHNIPTPAEEFWPKEIPYLLEEYGPEFYMVDLKTYYAQMVELGIFTQEYADWMLDLNEIEEQKTAGASSRFNGTVQASYGGYVPYEFSIFFIKGNDGKDKIVGLFGNGHEFVIDVPEGFDVHDFGNFMNDRDNILKFYAKYDFNNIHYEPSELKEDLRRILIGNVCVTVCNAGAGLMPAPANTI